MVTIHSLGEDRSFHFIEMEYVDGTSLRGIAEQDPPCTPLSCAQLGAQVASALAAAHAKNMVHGDVKPDNVLISRHSLAKLADFGLYFARRAGAKRLNWWEHLVSWRGTVRGEIQ
ncbi:MAG: protein kinase [Planctomycetota bacterium]